MFVSSTFRDMQRERDELAKQTFLQLRKRCVERGVTWGEVDLRWGIPDEQKQAGKVLPTCLAEIERCRPYFIGLLGERYGWVPEEIGADLVEERAWLGEYRGRSATELEIVQGVLRNPDMAGHAFFYLRDQAYIDTRPTAEQGELRELASVDELDEFGAQEAQRRAEERRCKLGALKERIRGSGFPVRDYPDPKALGDLVLADLVEVIDRLYPEGSAPDPLARQAAEHEAFAASRATVYVGRDEYFERLDTHAAGDGPPLVVLGESGVGKSALLANWVLRYRASHPAEPVLVHFIGSSPDSSDWRAMLRRIMGELGRRLGIEGEEVPDAPDQLRLAFADRLHATAAGGRTVLVIDALNQLEDRDGAPDLVWLPPDLPANVRLVVSTLPGRPLDALEKRGWLQLRVEPFTTDERHMLIVRYLGQHAKQLSQARVERIAASPQTASPLYLRAVLEELRVWGVHETLDARIEHYLAASTIDALFERILARYEDDYQESRPGLVRDAMSLIWAARHGLSEAELRDLLGSGGEPLPSAYWSPLSLAAEQSLVKRSGLIDFSHEYFRRAIEDRYLPRGSDRDAAHLRLADYFDTRRREWRGIAELPWQLAAASAWQRLRDLLGDLEFFGRAWGASEFDVKAYWARVEANSALRLADTYRSPVAEIEPEATWAFGLSKLLVDTGHTPLARVLMERFAELCLARDDKANLPASLVNLAVIVSEQGELDRAMALFREAERISRQLNEMVGLHRSLGGQATILLVRGELDDATSLLVDQEQICRAIGDRAGLAHSLGNRAVILKRQGRLDAAMALHEDEELIFRELGDRPGLHRSLANQATILQLRGEPDAAFTRYREWERTCREVGDRGGLQLALGNQATILVTKGELDAGMELFREQESICREIGDLDGLHRSLGNQAVILQRRGKLDAAMSLQVEKERICRELGDRAGLHLALGNRGQILMAQGQRDAAMTLLQEQERICRELRDQAGLQDSLGNQAAILLDRGELDRALALLGEQERVCRELGHRAGIAISLGNQALVLRQLGDLRSALGGIEEAERVLREIGDVLELAKSLVFKGALLSESGHEERALACVQEAHRIALQHGLTDMAGYVERLLTGMEQ